ncbi:MAG: hypothetical protein AAF092_10565 [Pseudomonadota bacterium]
MKTKDILMGAMVGGLGVVAGGLLLYYASRANLPLAAEARAGLGG